MLQGRVIKAYNSFFYVQTDMGLVTCKLRGKFKKSRQELGVVPGDWVSLDALPDGTGVIEEVQPRIQLLKRPAVANLTQVVLTFAAAQPDLHPLLLNRFLVLAEWSGMEKILICVNKMDLFVGNEENFLQDYRAIGYEVLPVSAREGKGLEALRQYQREWDDKAQDFRARPLHDWTSHAADAFRYLSAGLDATIGNRSGFKPLPKQKNLRVV